MFQCQRCGYETRHKGHLIKHLNTKKPCVVVLKDVNREQLIVEASVSKKPNIDDLLDIIKDYGMRIIALEKRLEILGSGNNIITNSFNNNTTVNIYTTVNFGFEKIDHIPKQVLYDCLLNKGVVELLKMVHFDKDHPENSNLRHKNRDYLEYYKDGWNIGPKGAVIDDWLVKGALPILKKVYLENKDKMIAEKGIENHQNIWDWLNAIYKMNEIVVKEMKPNLYSTLWTLKANKKS